MNEKLLNVFMKQEEEDKMSLEINIEEEIKQQLTNSEELIKQIHKEADKQQLTDSYQLIQWIRSAAIKQVMNPDELNGPMQQAPCSQPFQMFSPSYKNIVIRTAGNFSVRKHTSCLFPYYHSHDFYELIYVYEGQCIQYVNGVNQEMILNKGEACLLIPGVIHALNPSGENDLVLKFVIPRALMRKATEKMGTEKGMWIDSLETGKDVYVFSSELGRTYSGNWLIIQILEESYFVKKYQEAAIRNYLSLLLINLARRSVKNVDEELLETVSQYIKNDLKGADLSRFALQMGYSKRHLCRILQVKTGGSFTDILQHIRLNEASKLLTETDYTVDAVAEMVGYKNTSGFYKCFVNAFGMSSGLYRKTSERI